MRQPTWFSPEEARQALAKGREVKYAHELEAVIDRALERIHSTANSGEVESRRLRRNSFRAAPAPVLAHPTCVLYSRTLTRTNSLYWVRTRFMRR